MAYSRTKFDQRHQRKLQAPAPLPLSVPLGVQFSAPWALYANGICEVWRRLARALADAGMPTQLLLDELYGKPDPQAVEQVRHLLVPVRGAAYVGCFPTAGDAVQAAVINKLLLRHETVALTTMIERDRIGPQSVAIANKVPQWWLPTAHNVEVFRRCGVEASRLNVVHVPFFPDDPHLVLVGRRREPGPVHFYRIGVADTRKDFAKTILAFCRAFKPGEALLTLKTYAMVQRLDAWRSDERCLENDWTPDNFEQSVTIVNMMWNEEQIVDLHRRGDVYLSLSHGEGWDMPAMASLLAGNRLVFTASGGPQEFACETDLFVPTSATPLCDPYYHWEPDARWVDYDADVAAEKMREAAEGSLVKAHRRSWGTYTARDVGRQLRELLTRLIDQKKPTAELARSVSVKWTGAPVAVQATGIYSREELLAVHGPSSVREAVADGRTDVAVVYSPKTVPCGVASHVLNMIGAHPWLCWLRTLDEARELLACGLRTLVMEIALGEKPPTPAELVPFHERGVRVVFDHHHAEDSLAWKRIFSVGAAGADQHVFYSAAAPVIVGTGIYHPLPVPTFDFEPKPALGGLAFFGFADPSRRIDALVGVAERLRVPIYGYGPRLDHISQWYDVSKWTQFRAMRSYLSENDLAREIARHGVVLFARTATCPAYASASARFCMGTGVPVVVDATKTYADLGGAVTVVDYDAHAQVDAAVRRLLDDPQERGVALDRQRAYTARFSIWSLLNAMGIAPGETSQSFQPRPSLPQPKPVPAFQPPPRPVPVKIRRRPPKWRRW